MATSPVGAVGSIRTLTRQKVRAGHSSVVTVLDRYGHLLPGWEDRVDAKLEEMASAARYLRDGEPAKVVDLGAHSG